MGPRIRVVALAAALAWTAAGAQVEVTFADLEPILQTRCVMCHAGAAAPLGLRLDRPEALLAGSDRGPVVLPGDPDGSELVRRLRGEALPRMPLTGPPFLSDDEIDLFVRWIAAGARVVGAEPADVGAMSAPAPTAETADVVDDGPITFALVEPILARHCVRCHAASGVMGPPPEGYRLDSYHEALRADERARIVPFAPDASELVRRIRGHALPRMPLDGPPYLDDDAIVLIVDWIAEGARAADGTPAPVPVGARLRLHGTWLADGTLDGLPLDVSGARVDDARTGAHVEVRAVLAGDGRIVVERIRGR
jgi:uncharacterized membrane protein